MQAGCSMNRLFWHVLLAMVMFAGFSAFELLGEDEAILLREFFLEDAWPWLLLAIAIATVSELGFRYRDSRNDHARLSAALRLSLQNGERWRTASRHHAEGFTTAIRAQFREWGLTAGEGDVAMLLLKGLSHKEVAMARNSSSATVRQQATSIYHKSGMSSRAELAAFFLEDVFPSHLARGVGVNGATVSRPELVQHMS